MKFQIHLRTENRTYIVGEAQSLDEGHETARQIIRDTKMRIVTQRHNNERHAFYTVKGGKVEWVEINIVELDD